MQIGITQIILSDWNLDEILSLCQDAGYDALELHFRSGGALDPDLSDQEVAAVGRRCAEHGIQVPSVLASYSGPRNLLSDVEEEQEIGIRSLRRALEIAGILGCDTVLLHPGQLEPTGTYQEAWHRLQQSIRSLLPVAEANEAAIAIENVWNKFLLSPRETRAFVDEVDHPLVGVYLDTANMMAYGYAEHWIRELGHRIKKVHVKDFDRRAHRFVNLLEGDTDWPTVMQDLRDAGYTGPILHEVSGDREHHVEMARRMRRILEM